jgi:acetyl esterase/lipase
MNKKLVSKIVFGYLALALMFNLAGCSTSAPATNAAPAAVAATDDTQATSIASAVTGSTATASDEQLPVMPGDGRMPGGMGGPMTSLTPAFKDVAYASASSAEKLDLYLPSGNGPFPLVIMIHGGGFMMGDKSDGAGLSGLDQLVAAGYAVASINYRLSGEATYPAQINDAKAAVRFLRANAAQYKLNPDKFAAFGASAGGNLAALLGTTCGVKELEGEDLGNAGVSSCVQAVVDWFGPIDFLTMDQEFTGTNCPANHNDASSPESKLVGAAIQTVPDVVKTTNPTNYIDPSDPPFLIQNGSADCNIPPVQSKNFADALSKVIGADKVTYTLIDGAGHGGSQFSTDANLKVVIDFLNKYLQ